MDKLNFEGVKLEDSKVRLPQEGTQNVNGPSTIITPASTVTITMNNTSTFLINITIINNTNSVINTITTNNITTNIMTTTLDIAIRS